MGVRRPRRSVSPPISVATMPSVQSRVTPYLNARGPPAFSATLPPIEQNAEAGRIGRVEQPLRLDRRLQVAVDDARLDDRDAVVRR